MHFSLSVVKKSWNIFSGLWIFTAKLGPAEVKYLMNSWATSFGFCAIVLSTFIYRDRRGDFAFSFPVIFFHDLTTPRWVCLILMREIWTVSYFMIIGFFLSFSKRFLQLLLNSSSNILVLKVQLCKLKKHW